MLVRRWCRCVLWLNIVVLLAAVPAAATSHNYVYVGSGSGQLYGVDVDTGEVRFLSTSTETSSTINSLAANDNVCIACYGDATSIYRWDETTDAHVLVADLASAPYAPPFAGLSLRSRGGTFWDPTNTYYAGVELPGDIEAMYALVMTPDGRVWVGHDAPSGPNAGNQVLRELDIDLGAGAVAFTGAEVPLDPATSIAELTAPACRPQIGIAKTVGTPSANGDGSYTVSYTLRVENLGNVPL